MILVQKFCFLLFSFSLYGIWIGSAMLFQTSIFIFASLSTILENISLCVYSIVGLLKTRANW